MSTDPFAPEHNGGPVSHPRLVDGGGFLADASALLRSIQAATPVRPASGGGKSGCLACGGWAVRGQPLLPGSAAWSFRQPPAAPTGPFVLPLPPDGPPLSIEVHTLRFGNPDWMAECAPTLDAWCVRHHMPLYVTREWDASYPDCKFCEVDMLRSFLAGDKDWMIYVDADVVVHPQAPRPSFAEPGFYIHSDQYQFKPKQRKRWAQWCFERFSQYPKDSWVYRNAGVWVCDRASAELLMRHISLPYHAGIMEQNQFNWWLYLAGENGMVVRDLPGEWNRMDEVSASWFFHIYTKHKFKNLLKFRAAGLLPDHVKQLDAPPAVPDFGVGAVVWPYKSSAAEWDELWFSHRSVLAHWSEKGWPLVLLGDARPAWWPGEFIHAASYEEALWIGVQCAENVLWMNDDIFLLADQSPADLAPASHMGQMGQRLGETLVAANQWRRNLGQVLMRCHHHGRPTLNFSTHTPYLYQRDKAREVLAAFGLLWKLPFETAYHNWHRSPARAVTRKSSGPHDLAGKLWINPSMRQVTPAFRQEMAARFTPPPAPRLQAPVVPVVPAAPPPPVAAAPVQVACLACGRK